MGENSQQIGQHLSQNIGSIASAATSGLFSVFGAKKANQRNIENWHMQNAYNTPAAQMQRYKDAGLNPNLIYGQGNSGNAQPISATEKPELNLKDFKSPLETQLRYQDVQFKRESTDNLKKQGQVLIQDAILRAVQVANSLKDGEIKDSDIRIKRVDANRAENLYQNSLDAAEQSLRKLKAEAGIAENQVGISQNDLDVSNVTKNARISKIETEAKLIASQKTGVDRDNELKKLDIELKSLGIQPTDPIYFRILGRFLDDVSNKLFPKKAKRNAYGGGW